MLNLDEKFPHKTAYLKACWKGEQIPNLRNLQGHRADIYIV